MRAIMSMIAKDSRLTKTQVTMRSMSTLSWSQTTATSAIPASTSQT